MEPSNASACPWPTTFFIAPTKVISSSASLPNETSPAAAISSGKDELNRSISICSKFPVVIIVPETLGNDIIVVPVAPVGRVR